MLGPCDQDVTAAGAHWHMEEVFHILLDKNWGSGTTFKSMPAMTYFLKFREPPKIEPLALGTSLTLVHGKRVVHVEESNIQTVTEWSGPGGLGCAGPWKAMDVCHLRGEDEETARENILPDKSELSGAQSWEVFRRKIEEAIE